MMQPAKRRLFVFTCAVTPGSATPSLKLRDSGLRRADYRVAVQKWAHLLRPESDDVLLVENTGSDVGDLIGVFESAGLRTFSIGYQESVDIQSSGKGNAEAAMFDRVMDWYRATDSLYDEIFKVTGRLFVNNLDCLDSNGEGFRGAQNFLRVRVRVDRTQVDTRFFSASPAVWQTYLTGLKDYVVESEGIYLEHVVARQLASAVFDGVVWIPFSRMPRIVGVSGSTGLRYGGIRERIYGSVSSVFSRLLYDQYV